jgi:predicted transcriptional regulator
LNILNQIKSYSTFGGRGFDVNVINQTLKEMTDEGYIDYVEKIDSFKITQKGRDALD